jgi:hypothetical protein
MLQAPSTPGSDYARLRPQQFVEYILANPELNWLLFDTTITSWCCSDRWSMRRGRQHRPESDPLGRRGKVCCVLFFVGGSYMKILATVIIAAGLLCVGSAQAAIRYTETQIIEIETSDTQIYLFLQLLGGDAPPLGMAGRTVCRIDTI